MKKQTLILFIFLLSITLPGWFFSGYPLQNYLSLHKPLETANILIAESWLESSELDFVAKHYNERNYRYLFTTGFPLNQDLLMYKNGTFRLNIDAKVPDNQISNLQVKLQGTLPFKYASVFNLFVDDKYIATDSVGKQAKIFGYSIENKDSIKSVSIKFTNDALIEGKDRNLHVLSIILNGVSYPVLDTNATYFITTYDDSSVFKLGETQAVIARNLLIRKGVAKNDIIAINGNKPGKSKTFTTAENTIRAIDSVCQDANYSINIISTLPHTRRTYLAYCKFHTSDSVGIIAVPSSSIKKYEINRSGNIRELMGILLIKSYFKK